MTTRILHLTLLLCILLSSNAIALPTNHIIDSESGIISTFQAHQAINGGQVKNFINSNDIQKSQRFYEYQLVDYFSDESYVANERQNDEIIYTPTSSVPEPTTLILMGLGLAGISLRNRKK